MKTIKKEIKCWANYYPDSRKDPIVNWADKEDAIKYASTVCKHVAVPCTVILELPVEEPTATIKPSDIEKAIEEYWITRKHGADLTEFLKKKLFPEETK